MNHDSRKKVKIGVSIGIFAHNEEKNIEKLLRSIEQQKLDVVQIKEIVVISSGSFDKTNRMVRNQARKDKRIVLIDDVLRRGKSAAINQFIRVTKQEVLVTVSADLRLNPRAIEEIAVPFLNDDVGMVGARPKPSNVRSSEIGEEIELLWELHHRISLIKPKCGEMVAFRNVIRSIPRESAVDEATLEVLLSLVGYHVVYAPRSIVYNKGPGDAKEYVAQRRRVYAGHQWVSQKFNYQVVTMNWGRLFQVVMLYFLTHPSKIRAMTRLIGMEILARTLGWVDYYVFQKNPFVWKMISR